MRFEVHYRADDEEAWKLIDDELTNPQIPLATGGIGDGRYRFRVRATDEPANPPGEALEDVKISDEVVVDNTPPRFERIDTRVRGRRATLVVEVEDDLSLIAALHIDIDNGDVFPLAPQDRLIDQRAERFEWQTSELEPGEHTITIAVTDREGNSAVNKAVFTVD